MSTTPFNPRAYDPLTLRLHWLIAIGVAAQWGGAHLIDSFPRGPIRVDARSVHIMMGACLLGLLAIRVYWRATKGTQFAPDVRWPMAARLGHAGLYLLLVVTLVLGLTDAVVRRDSIFGLFRLPSIGDLTSAARHALDKQVVGLHNLAANLLLSLAIGHALVAIAHHLILRDDVLVRMAPVLRGPPQRRTEPQLP